MTVKAPTTFVPADSGGMYTPPERVFDRMRAITAHLQPVNCHGFDRPRATPDASVTPVVPATAPTDAPPSMAQALSRAADAVGVELAPLLDSVAFTAELGRISPADGAGLEEAIRRHMPAPTPGMRPNAAQGASSATIPAAPKNLLERLQMETEKALSQPTPPGSTFE